MTTSETHPRGLVVTLGDPRGVGPEVAAKALESLLEEDRTVEVQVVGPGDSLRRWWTRSPSERVVIHDVPWSGGDDVATAGCCALRSLEAGLELALAAPRRALVTAPLAKSAVALSHPGFRGHTGWLGDRLGAEPVMLLASDALRVFLVTDHLAIAEVAPALDRERVTGVIRAAVAAMREVLGGEKEPRVAVLGLNPHAGEEGELGREEIEIIAPAIADAGGEQGGVFGPFAADSFFRPDFAGRFDAVVAQYHDQGLIPLKMQGFGASVNVSVGLPLVRTSPDHGTAFDIAGRGIADASSMRAAMDWALRML